MVAIKGAWEMNTCKGDCEESVYEWEEMAMKGASKRIIDVRVIVRSQNTSNGGCRHEEKSRKHWSLFTMLLSSVIT